MPSPYFALFIIMTSLVNYRPAVGYAATAGHLARIAYRNRGAISNTLSSVGDNIRSMARRFNSRRQSSSRSYRRNLRRASKTFRRGGVSAGRGVTQQHDFANVYRKKSMPKGKRVQWKRFVNKVHAVAERDLGSRTVVFNNQLTVQENVTGDQLALTCSLYPQKSTNSWLDDLNQIGALENTGDESAAAGINVAATTKFLFQSGIMDLTVRNTTFYNGDGIIGGKMEVDVYQVLVRKDVMDGSAPIPNLSQLFLNTNPDEKALGGSGQKIQMSLRGITPFERNASLSRYGIKILSKRKYFVEAGGTFTYQVRDPKRHACTQKDLTDKDGFNRRNWTRTIYLIGKAVPGIPVGPGLTEYTQQLNVGITRKYLYKIEGANDDRNEYISASSTVTTQA